MINHLVQEYQIGNYLTEWIVRKDLKIFFIRGFILAPHHKKGWMFSEALTMKLTGSSLVALDRKDQGQGYV